MQGTPAWTTWREMPAVCLYPNHLRKSVLVALVVGTVLFGINQLDVVLSGRATPLVVAKILITFLVPFCVANYGILVACYRRGGG